MNFGHLQTLKPILLISRLLGIAPYTLDSNGIQTNSLWRAYSAIMTIFTIVACCGNAWESYDWSQTFSSLTDAIPICIVVCSYLISTILSLSQAVIFPTGGLLSFVNMMESADKLLVTRQRTNRLAIRRWSVVFICSMLAIYLLLFIREVVEYSFYWFDAIYPSIVLNSVFIYRFIICALLLRSSLNVLNESLSQFGGKISLLLDSISISTPLHLTFVSYCGNTNCSRGGVNNSEHLEVMLSISSLDKVTAIGGPVNGHVFANPRRTKFCRNKSQFNDSISDMPNPDFTYCNLFSNSNHVSHVCSSIFALCKAHSLLCDAGDCLSESYGVPLLGNFGHILVSIVAWTFCTLRFVVARPGFSAPFALLGLSMMLYELGLFFLLVWACHDVLKAEAKTVKLTNMLLIQVESVAASASEQQLRVATALRHLSEQLLHERLHLSAAGMLPLDRGLLLSTAAAAVTHILILLQFVA